MHPQAMGWGKWGEGQRRSKNLQQDSALSLQPDMGLDLPSLRSRPEPKSRVRRSDKGAAQVHHRVPSNTSSLASFFWGVWVCVFPLLTTFQRKVNTTFTSTDVHFPTTSNIRNAASKDRTRNVPRSSARTSHNFATRNLSIWPLTISIYAPHHSH